MLAYRGQNLFLNLTIMITVNFLLDFKAFISIIVKKCNVACHVSIQVYVTPQSLVCKAFRIPLKSQEKQSSCYVKGYTVSCSHSDMNENECCTLAHCKQLQVSSCLLAIFWCKLAFTCFMVFDLTVLHTDSWKKHTATTDKSNQSLSQLS